jgi:hypothetical protein
MTELELTAIEARANAATAGPWAWVGRKDSPLDVSEGSASGLVSLANLKAYEEDGLPPVAVFKEVISTDADADDSWMNYSNSNDITFIAHSRLNIPALIAEVRRLWAAEAAREEYDDWAAGHAADRNLSG